MAAVPEFGSQGSAASASSVATIAGLDFNAEASDRIIAACIAYEDADAIASVTIGGVAAGVWVDASGSTRRSEIWTAEVPTGTSGDVVVTLASGDATISVSTVSVTGADPTPTDTDEVTATSGVGVSIAALTVPTDGCAIAVFCNGSNSATGTTWTGASEAHDNLVVSLFRHSSALTTTAGTNTITAASVSAAQSLVGVAFGPASGGGATTSLPPVQASPLPPAMFLPMAWHPQEMRPYPFSNTPPAPPAGASLIYRPTFFDHMIIR